MSAFLQGLVTFPRLFSVTSLAVNGGALVTGGAPVNPATTGYQLTLEGDIFYSTGQSDVCAAAATSTAAPLSSSPPMAACCAAIGPKGVSTPVPIVVPIAIAH